MVKIDVSKPILTMTGVPMAVIDDVSGKTTYPSICDIFVHVLIQEPTREVEGSGPPPTGPEKLIRYALGQKIMEHEEEGIMEFSLEQVTLINDLASWKLSTLLYGFIAPLLDEGNTVEEGVDGDTAITTT